MIKIPIEQFRKQNQLKFVSLFQPFGGDYEKNAANLEIGIYNYAIQEATHKKIVKSWQNKFFQTLYIDRLKTIYLNLTDNVLTTISKNELKSQDFATMTHQEMMPKKWKELIEKKQKRESSINKQIRVSTDLFVCKKCLSKNCTYYELQIRSADEPATMFVSCLDCGKHWRN